MDQIVIRPTAPADLPAINDIYNHYVVHSTCTFQTEPETIEGRRAWFDHHDETYPIVVAEQDRTLVGWASLSRYHTRCAYRFTVEDSVYVRHDAHRRGIGGRLLADLIERARAIGHHSILALIAADQPASIVLHERHGFVPVAHLREVGFKFNRWIDVRFMQCML